MTKQLLTSCLLATLFIASGCGGARPYSLMYKSASSELSGPAQARDHRLKANLRAALIGEQGLAGLTLSPEVLMERGYVSGHVDTPEQAATIQRIAHGVSGLRSVDVYLPISQSQPADSSTISDVTIHTEISAALKLAPGVVASRINVTVLDRQAVLLGVVSGDEERRHAVEAVSGVEGVKGVTNWLLLPEPDYMAVRPKLR
ncbi:MAG TPA: BON domain-containing protein [Nitrospira sp.]|jgi:hyperosmotically inducible protein|nr:BON domain-containing protein [Nitrospira sp.]